MLHTNLYSLVVIKSIQLCVYVKPKLEHINASELLSGYSIILTPASTETSIIFPLLELHSINRSWWKSVIMRSTYHVPQTPLISQPVVLWLATDAIKKYLPFCTCKQWFCVFIPWPCSATWHGSFWHSDIQLSYAWWLFYPPVLEKSLQEQLNREQGTGMFVETVI